MKFNRREHRQEGMKPQRREGRRGTQRRHELHELTRIRGEELTAENAKSTEVLPGRGNRQKDGGKKMESFPRRGPRGGAYVVSYKNLI